MWRVQHPSGAREIDELHVPANTNVRLVMTSQDVIHSLFLPALRMKQDILPDRYTYLWFNANKTGIFHFICAEFCGTDHSLMAGRFVIAPPDDYARWTAAQPEATTSPSKARRCFVSLGCSGCHAPGSTRARAGSAWALWTRVQLDGGGTVTADEAYLRDCILLPDKHSPPAFRRSCRIFQGSRERGAKSYSSSPTSNR